MIRTLSSAPLFDGTWHQVSCLYDATLYRDDTAERVGIVLPPALNRAVPQRQAEFVAGRYCAGIALAHLHAGTAEIGIGANRQPLWPRGIVGSITHTRGYASAALARTDTVRALGIDTEQQIQPGTAAHVSQQILAPNEASGARHGTFASTEQFLTLVFSAKESLFKCLFPLTYNSFGFHAAYISPAATDARGAGVFHFELLENLNAEFRRGFSGYGQYVLQGMAVHTAVSIAA